MSNLSTTYWKLSFIECWLPPLETLLFFINVLLFSFTLPSFSFFKLFKKVSVVSLLLCLVIFRFTLMKILLIYGCF